MASINPHFTTVPDMDREIFSHLDDESLVTIRQTCHYVRRITCCDNFWRARFVAKHGLLPTGGKIGQIYCKLHKAINGAETGVILIAHDQLLLLIHMGDKIPFDKVLEEAINRKKYNILQWLCEKGYAKLGESLVLRNNDPVAAKIILSYLSQFDDCDRWAKYIMENQYCELVETFFARWRDNYKCPTPGKLIRWAVEDKKYGIIPTLVQYVLSHYNGIKNHIKNIISTLSHVKYEKFPEINSLAFRLIDIIDISHYYDDYNINKALGLSLKNNKELHNYLWDKIHTK